MPDIVMLGAIFDFASGTEEVVDLDTAFSLEIYADFVKSIITATGACDHPTSGICSTDAR